jgi:hypothetical protein
VKLTLADAIDLTGAKSVARQTHNALSEANKEQLDLLNCAHLTKSVALPTDMVHSLKLTMQQLMDTEFALKVRHTFVIAFQNGNDCINSNHTIR